MIVVLSALVLGTTVLIVAPIVLARGRWQVRRPGLALALWQGGILVGAILVAIGVAAGISLALFGETTAVATEVTIAAVIGWIALGVLGSVAAVTMTRADTVVTAGRRNAGAVLDIPHVRHELSSGASLVVCETDEIFALTIPGRRRAVAVSTGTMGAFGPDQLAAVIAHEVAHLRGRHDLSLRLADLSVACLPRTASMRAFRRRTGLLLELLADDAAVRDVGARPLAEALEALALVAPDASLLVRAERLRARSDFDAPGRSPLVAELVGVGASSGGGAS